MREPGALPDWRQVLPSEEREVFALAGYGAASRELGSRPAVLVIDVTYAFTGTRPMPLREAIEQYRTSCGERAWRAIPAMRRVIDSARTMRLPVFYSVPAPRTQPDDLGSWQATNRRAAEDLRDDPMRDRVVAEIAPEPEDTVIRKRMPSVFFQTDLVQRLQAEEIDTLVCVGGSASGCVRATVVDGFSYGFTMAVVDDGCFDRSELMWGVTMFDLHAKYAQVGSSYEMVDQLTRR